MADEPKRSKKLDRFELVTQQLGRLGIKPDQYVWRPRQAELFVIVGGKIKVLKVSASMSKMALAATMGRIQGWMEIAA